MLYPTELQALWVGPAAWEDEVPLFICVFARSGVCEPHPANRLLRLKAPLAACAAAFIIRKKPWPCKRQLSMPSPSTGPSPAGLEWLYLMKKDMVGAGSRLRGKMPAFPHSIFPAPEREPDMAGQKLETGACRRFSQTGRRPSLKTATLLILVGLWLTASLAAAPAPAAPQNTPLEKGKNPMPQVAAASVKEVPPSDKSQPSRVETFTFGLG